MKKNSALKFLLLLISCFLVLFNSELSAEKSENNNTLNVNTKILDNHNSHYLLGPGDLINVSFPNSSNASRNYLIDSNGNLKIYRLGTINVSNLSIEQLEKILSSKFSEFLRFPEAEILIIKPKPIQILIKGEVKRPGFYTFGGDKSYNNSILEYTNTSGNLTKASAQDLGQISLFDLIQRAGGITFYSDLENIMIQRKFALNPYQIEKRKTEINFLDFLNHGNFSQNINLMNGDIIEIKKSDISIKEKLDSIMASNINPDAIDVYIVGAVKRPGLTKLKNGTTLNEGILIAQNFQTLRGKIEFVRLNSDGSIDKRKISFKKNARRGSYNNPTLLPGDLISVNESIIGNSFNKINVFTSPLIGIFTLLNLIEEL